jgi:hypothetical protein
VRSIADTPPCYSTGRSEAIGVRVRLEGPTHRRRVPEEKGLMARSMAKSSTTFSTESAAG